MTSATTSLSPLPAKETPTTIDKIVKNRHETIKIFRLDKNEYYDTLTILEGEISTWPSLLNLNLYIVLIKTY